MMTMVPLILMDNIVLFFGQKSLARKHRGPREERPSLRHLSTIVRCTRVQRDSYIS